ncbi:hypothetical protein DCS_02728 [Drechmeria coniospora]|uniref:Uncharacterized protein n=1 Tax=Drechmeria coniospora TaxID=98403 RepID=A0A151GWU9_DRECN|nr:hypothetical protein DCS_02728 [Drechmeria coniospora]KYK61585.1 hypothetical protein DCS_02728 [Drechmeria coniospora]
MDKFPSDGQGHGRTHARAIRPQNLPSHKQRRVHGTMKSNAFTLLTTALMAWPGQCEAARSVPGWPVCDWIATPRLKLDKSTKQCDTLCSRTGQNDGGTCVNLKVYRVDNIIRRIAGDCQCYNGTRLHRYYIDWSKAQYMDVTTNGGEQR